MGIRKERRRVRLMPPPKDKLIPIKNCSWCRRPFKPKKRKQRNCSLVCGARSKYRDHPLIRFVLIRAAKRAGQIRRRKAIINAVGRPITERDETIYKLAWEHCMNTHKYLTRKER